MERRGLARARSGLLLALVIEVTVLVVTGISLFFLYRPSVGQAWGDVADATTRSVGIASALRLVHRLASTFALWTSIGLGAVLAIGVSVGRRWTGAALGAGIAVTTVLHPSPGTCCRGTNWPCGRSRWAPPFVATPRCSGPRSGSS